MWSSLISLAVALGVAGISKLADKFKFSGHLTDSELTSLASKVITAASAKGSTMLNKASEVINSIPALSGSSSVKDYLNKARSSAYKHLNNVESKIEDMTNKANDIAGNLQNQTGKAFVTRAREAIFNDPNSEQNQAINSAKEFVAGLQGVENNV